MHVLKGVAASPGITIGTAHVHLYERQIPEIKHIKPEEAPHELERLRKAFAASIKALNNLEGKIKENLGAEYSQIIATHKAILSDPLLKENIKKKVLKENFTAESAIYTSLQEINISFEQIEDEFFRERKNDVFDVAKRLFENLTGTDNNVFKNIKTPSVLVAHNLLPSDTLSLREHQVLAFCTDIGGKTSHTALLAQSLELPAVVGLSNITSQVRSGDPIIVDGESGIVIVNPDRRTLAYYKKTQRNIKKSEQLLKAINDLPFITTDGKQVNMLINYDPRTDSKETKKLKTMGLGLLRTEFLYIGKPQPPTEQEQVDIYTQVAKRFDMRPVQIRLADLGGDKQHSLDLSEYVQESNPFMGIRGVRFLLKHEDLLRTQLRAIVKTAAIVPAHIKIIVPMISNIEEVRAVKAIFRDTLAELAQEGVAPRNKIHFGIMVEVPSTALTLDSMVSELDFVSIGTNDLIQYMVAVDRGNQEVADLYDPFNPSVIRVLGHIIQTCSAKKVPASICGELASDPDYIPLLIGLGVDTLSTSPRMFLRIKNKLRNVSYDACSNLAQAALLSTSSEEIKKLSLTVIDENP
ncbi:phosphotransferase system enzyme I (PtsI) [Elusimicrobium posterum]|uniref:phosphoenolpyruvate--protein phosphotransferase n=1 Tax=Elusimicrobium posterum TaxID=3116653 RepID=UPI003C732C96